MTQSSKSAKPSGKGTAKASKTSPSASPTRSGQPAKTVRTVAALRRAITDWRGGNETIALVPTMGALHRGHISLVTLAKRKADRVVVSIFINPTQFAAGEDLSRYPRDEAGDLAKLAAAGVDLVWCPTVAEMYPDGFSTSVQPGSAAKDLEGAARPTHFAGVATVCCKLFNQVTPDIAVFGEKDYQQLCVLRQMVRDLNLPLKLIGGATQREKDGLALSSRNVYLSAEQRAAAPELHATLKQLAAAVGQGASLAQSLAKARRRLDLAGFTSVDYLEVRDAETLMPVPPQHSKPARALAAVWLGTTRLIDNQPIPVQR